MEVREGAVLVTVRVHCPVQKDGNWRLSGIRLTILTTGERGVAGSGRGQGGERRGRGGEGRGGGCAALSKLGHD